MYVLQRTPTCVSHGISCNVYMPSMGGSKAGCLQGSNRQQCISRAKTRRVPVRGCLQGQRRNSGCPLRCTWRGSDIVSDRRWPLAYHYMQDISATRAILLPSAVAAVAAGSAPVATTSGTVYLGKSGKSVATGDASARLVRPELGGNLSQIVFVEDADTVRTNAEPVYCVPTAAPGAPCGRGPAFDRCCRGARAQGVEKTCPAQRHNGMCVAERRAAWP
jgi:hypothetical protein